MTDFLSSVFKISAIGFLGGVTIYMFINSVLCLTTGNFKVRERLFVICATISIVFGAILVLMLFGSLAIDILKRVHHTVTLLEQTK